MFDAAENATFAGRHSCDSPEWYTPGRFVEAARDVMGGIDLDPASHEEANRTVKATTFFTKEDDGLVRGWHGRVFLNPPGGDGLVPRFWRVLICEFAQHRVEQAIWIGYSLEQLQTLQQACATTPLHYPMCVPKARIAFVENEAKRVERLANLIAKGEKPNATERAQKIAAACRAGRPPKDAPSHANYITYLGEHVDRFVEAFSQFGGVKR